VSGADLDVVLDRTEWFVSRLRERTDDQWLSALTGLRLSDNWSEYRIEHKARLNVWIPVSEGLRRHNHLQAVLQRAGSVGWNGAERAAEHITGAVVHGSSHRWLAESVARDMALHVHRQSLRDAECIAMMAAAAVILRDGLSESDLNQLTAPMRSLGIDVRGALPL
jgi:hypothetical protein